MKKICHYILFFSFIVGCQTNKSDLITQIDHSINWLPERNDVQAGAILVPENHNEPDGKKIQITYVVIKSKDSSSNAFPVIRFSGGPGGNSLLKNSINNMLDDPLRDERDIILFDQRGIGYSSALPDMSRGVFDIMSRDANEEEEMVLMTELLLHYKKKCEEQNIIPEYYNSIQSAKDIGMLFKHLGYEKYNIMGGSYGTRLGRIVQDMFPEYINSSTLDSPAPLSDDFLLSRLDSYSLAIGRIFDYCENDPNCNNQYPKLKDDYFEAIAILDKRPLEVSMSDSLKVFINAQDGIYLLRRLLYQGNSREKAPELIKAYLEGGGQVINDLLKNENQLTGRLNISMLLSVEKYENFYSENTAQVIEQHYKKLPLIPAKLGFFDAFYQAGNNWHKASLPIEDRIFQDSDIPTLIFVNQFDPATPPENGHLFMKKLSRGTLLILDEGGHGGGDTNCKSQVIIEFMKDSNKNLDTSCLNLFSK